MAGIEDIQSPKRPTRTSTSTQRRSVPIPDAHPIQFDVEDMPLPEDPVGWVLAALDAATRTDDEDAVWGSDDVKANDLLDVMIRTHYIQRPDYLAGVASSGVTAAEYSEESHRVAVQALRWPKILREWCAIRGSYHIWIQGDVSEQARRITEKKFLGSGISISWA
jgi:hypothetical protein